VDGRLAALADDFAVVDGRNHPERATAAGDHRFDGMLADLSDEGRQAARRDLDALRARLLAIDEAPLDEEDRLSRAVLAARLDEESARLDLDLHRFMLDPLAGPHVALLELIDEDHPRRDAVDGELLLARLRAVPRHFADHRAQLDGGRRDGLLAPRPLAARVLAQLQAAVDGEAARVLGRAVDDFRRRLGEGALVAALREASAQAVAAFAGLRDAVAALVPLAREAPGLCALPTGAGSYRVLAALHTTTSLTPDQLHDLGRELVAAAVDERARLPRPDLPAADAIGDPVGCARAFVDRAEEALPSRFTRLPSRRCRVAPIPSTLGDAPAAYYVPPADDADHGTFFVRARRPPAPHHLEVLAAHEALPGHHLQLALALELPLPDFRRRADFTAFVEGWGLYAERLADEIGLYSEAGRFALAEHRAWRAARLVVDTGLHARGWSVAEARAYLAAHAPLTGEEVAGEVERQIADPGQALAYAVGERAFVEAREEARARLHDRFSLAAFHDRVLSAGALPLGLLRARVAAWEGT